MTTAACCLVQTIPGAVRFHSGIKLVQPTVTTGFNRRNHDKERSGRNRQAGACPAARGIFKRKPDNKKETSKRQPTVPIPPRLLAHMRRWKRLGISQRAVIEFNGKPVEIIKAGWNTVVEKAGLATEDKKQKVIRHTLRHTAITWYLTPDRRTAKAVDIEKVSQYCGVSEKTIRETYRHVMPGTFDAIMAASHHFGR